MVSSRGLFLFSLLLTSFITKSDAKLVTFDNVVGLKYDINGNILDAHDGIIRKFPSTGTNDYYLLGLSYGDCHEPANLGCDQTPDKCGFQFNHSIHLWSSPDLSNSSWTYITELAPVSARPQGTVFRPDLIYNSNTGLFVLWYNWVAANGTYMGFAAYTSPTISGTYTLQKEVVQLTHANSTYHAGDFHLYVSDPDANGNTTAYVIYGAEFWMWIDKLTPDFLGTTGEFVNQLGGIYFVEAPALIKYNNVYYAIFDHCCCFCYQGSGIRVYTAPDPLGPWTVQGGDRACEPPSMTPASSLTTYYTLDTNVHASPTPGQGCLYNNSNYVSVTRSQQSYIAQVDTPTGPVMVWVGDRWQQSPDTLKSHDPQYHYPLQFDKNGVVQNVSWIDSFTLDVI